MASSSYISLPTRRTLVPWFRQRSTSNPAYTFRYGGGPGTCCSAFFGSAVDPAGPKRPPSRRVHAKPRACFDDVHRLLFRHQSRTLPTRPRVSRMRESWPGIRSSGISIASSAGKYGCRLRLEAPNDTAGDDFGNSGYCSIPPCALCAAVPLRLTAATRDAVFNHLQPTPGAGAGNMRPHGSHPAVAERIRAGFVAGPLIGDFEQQGGAEFGISCARVEGKTTLVPRLLP